MWKVSLEFANRTEQQTFADKVTARIYATNLGDMFNAEEIFLDQNIFRVTVPHMEISE